MDYYDSSAFNLVRFCECHGVVRRCRGGLGSGGGGSVAAALAEAVAVINSPSNIYAITHMIIHKLRNDD